MMRWRMLLVLTAGLLTGADPQDEAAKKDMERFQGNWRLVSVERDGKKTPPDEANKITLAIRENKFTLKKDSVVLSEGLFSLAPTKKPKEIDETITVGPNKGKVFLAIYEI